MLIAIERSQFNYLYKQNSLPADKSRIYWHDKAELLNTQADAVEKAILELDKILPRFEEDHEILLLDYDQKTWEYNEYKELKFSGVLSIIPLTALGKRLLIGKLNERMKIAEPLFNVAVEAIKSKRSLRLRRLAAEKLLSLFSLVNPPSSAVSMIEQAASYLIGDSKSAKGNGNVFQTLFDYNTTEGFIPEGNVEFLCKVAVLARLQLGQEPSLVQNGPFYKEVLNLTSVLNRMGLLEAYREFVQISSDAIPATQKIKEIVNGSLDFDMFFVAYVFFAFRKRLNQSEHNLNTVRTDLEKLKSEKPLVASIVMYAIGTVFSFEQLYEGIHVLSEAPLLIKQNHPKRSPAADDQEPQKQVSGIKHIIKPTGAMVVYPDYYEEIRENPETKAEEAERIDPTSQPNDSMEKGIPVRLFKEFAQEKLPRKGKDILSLVEAYNSELKNGITFKWLNDKLLFDDSANGKKSKISNKSIKDIKEFFENNKVKEAN